MAAGGFTKFLARYCSQMVEKESIAAALLALLRLKSTTQRCVDLGQHRQRQHQLPAIVGLVVRLDRVSLEVDGRQLLHVAQLWDLGPVSNLQSEGNIFKIKINQQHEIF